MNRISFHTKFILLLIFSSQMQFTQNIISETNAGNYNIYITDSVTHPKLNSNYYIKGLKKILNTNNILNEKENNPYEPLLNGIELNGGLLLVEYSHHIWRDQWWKTDSKNLYKYDYNFNCIEIIRQIESNVTGLENKYRNTYIYDNNKNVIESVAQNWDGLNWVNVFRNFYNYNDQNYLTEYLIQVWDSVNWVNDIRIILDYNENNDCVRKIHQSWNGATWINNQMLLYSYDLNENLTEVLWQLWDESTLINQWREVYHYDINNNLVEYINQDWNGVDWINYDRYLYKYDNNKNMIESTFQKWEDSIFKNISRYLYAFDQNNYKISEVYQTWNWDSVWISKDRKIYRYDSKGNNIEMLAQGKQYLSDSVWTDYYKWVHSFDIYNNKTLTVWQNWDGTNWVNYSKSNYTSIPKSGLDGNVNNYWLANNYPNPFNSSTTIRYLIPTEELITLKVFNSLGEELAILVNEVKPAGVYEITWNPVNLSSGVYFYQLKAGNSSSGSEQSFIKTKKMILLR